MATLEEQLRKGEPMEMPIARAVARELYGPDARVAKLPTYTNIDIAVILGEGDDAKLVGFLEIKTRANASGTYPSTVVAEEKYKAARALRAALKAPTALVVMFTDTIGVWRLFEKPEKIEMVVDRARGEGRPHCFYLNHSMRRCDQAFADVVLEVGAAPVQL